MKRNLTLTLLKMPNLATVKPDLGSARAAHNLEIEYGRYKNILREQRKCKWCDLAVYTSHEHDVLFECDLYANIRSKLARTLNNTMGKIDCNLDIRQKHTRTRFMMATLPTAGPLRKFFRSTSRRIRGCTMTEQW